MATARVRRSLRSHSKSVLLDTAIGAHNDVVRLKGELWRRIKITAVVMSTLGLLLGYGIGSMFPPARVSSGLRKIHIPYVTRR